MKIVGSSKQDGIPSPDNPVEIKNETILIITDKEGNKKEMPFKYEKILKEDDKIEKINEKWYLVRRKHMNEEEIELINGFFNKGWCCDLDEVYNVVMKLQDLYNKEIQRNKDLEQIEKEHKEENGRLREELSQYKRIDKLVSNITPEEVDTAIKRASEQFIEVSKVEEELIQLNKDEKTELKGMKGQNKYFLKQQYAAKREILEKVLKMKGR